MALHSDTIFALSSGRGRAGVAVVRVSGPHAASAVRRLAGPEVPAPRTAALRKIVTAAGELIDDGLLLWFPGPASFTGEDVAEFHIHGGRAVLDALLRALGEISGLRPAEPGEFTRRAVENGKFDLTQAEALADLIKAETEAQRRQALRQYDGALFDLYEDWRQCLIRAAAWVEAAIDFSDEEIPSDSLARAKAQVAEIAAQIRDHLNDDRRGEILREGFCLTVIGPPNSGKSSLINALARRDVAIVSEIAGTTRDVLEVHLDLGGYPVIVADTAGLRETADRIEAEGVRRALARSEAADAVLLLLDATAPAAELPPLPQTPALTVWNKTDLAPGTEGAVSISVRTGAGIDSILGRVRNIVSERLGADVAPPLTRERHRHAILCAVEALDASFRASEPELVAEEMRIAMRELGRITGRVDVEELLDVVFRDFCIGK
ncbi:MAG TPA: tRNA uridine-5-carboxymethylaminomethyl(34) synthesis GTPase MnmE [Rhizomicrobium sp.]|jgi:tRNA modification GTPase|nr:tRNA uridine-5-carboxymethylaminomethyl(34) synthesis GTPase MnmE [Rhizomicrobium sp.]